MSPSSTSTIRIIFPTKNNCVAPCTGFQDLSTDLATWTLRHTHRQLGHKSSESYEELHLLSQCPYLNCPDFHTLKRESSRFSRPEFLQNKNIKNHSCLIQQSSQIWCSSYENSRQTKTPKFTIRVLPLSLLLQLFTIF